MSFSKLNRFPTPGKTSSTSSSQKLTLKSRPQIGGQSVYWIYFTKYTPKFSPQDFTKSWKSSTLFLQISKVSGEVVPQKALNEKAELYAILIDFCKAFDSVNHTVLCEIIDYLNLGELGEAIKAAFLNMKFKIRIDADTFSDTIEISRGIPQGSALSPVSFVLYLLPLQYMLLQKNNSPSNSHTAYADDVTLLANHKPDILAQWKVATDFEKDFFLDINQKTELRCLNSSNPPDISTHKGLKIAPTDGTHPSEMLSKERKQSAIGKK
jgi:hypothetical protein